MSRHWTSGDVGYSRNRLRLTVVIGVFGISSLSIANSAMAPLHGIGDDTWWGFYILGIYVLELGFISSYFRVPIPKAAYVSLVGNLVSALIGFMLCGLWSAAVGSANPLVESIKILFLGGIASAVMEAGIWQMMLQPRGASIKQFIHPSLLAHGSGVVLGIAILLLQPHPFLGAAQSLNQGKKVRLISEIKRALEMYMERSDAMPPGHDADSWIKAFEANSKQPILIPEFVTFDRVGRRSTFHPSLEINPCSPGRPFKALAREQVWVIGWKEPSPLRFYAQDSKYSRFRTRRP